MTTSSVVLSAQACEACGWRFAAVGIVTDDPTYADRILFECPSCREMAAGIVAGVEVPAGSQLRASVLAHGAIADEMARLRAGRDRRA